MRKPVCGVSDHVRNKPGCTFVGLKLAIKEVEGGNYNHVMKTKGLIRCAVTAHLTCAFVFTNRQSRFSHDAAQFIHIVL